MRNIWPFVALLRISAFSACALCRSSPNGFSTTTRRNAPSSSFNSPASPSFSITGPKNRAATAR